ncbi:type IVB secretion system protein IcmN/DotK [Legionella lytica]|uniref:Type IVB secretion system protein IcmN/DotK n=1 Tax=Legionella lytica TaxID=96232 RepID=A0ABY4YA77_9GAMM|nr:type IVB secretion system protein IcmN/DotK [Legionella lytica]USQ14135.1 type IVB secretion system protein IcmN/DotK [Legionella lytica]
MRSILTRYIVWLIRAVGAIALCIMIASCGRDYWALPPDLPRGPCKDTGACDTTIIKYMKKFNKHGVKVVSIGQDYMVSIPATFLFHPQTPNIKWRSYRLLNDVAIFLKQFRKISVFITGYSSKYGSPARERALTLARTRVVSEYLWSQGIDSRFIFTQGLGSDKPIIAYPLGGDYSANARIEITFRRAAG